jgi:hypothetical protein
MANDLWGSIAEWFKEKTSSPLYGVFLVSYVVCNWKKFYVLFWEYGAPPSGTRLEFITNNLLPFHGTGPWLYPSVLANWVSGLIAPVIITILIIKYAPHLEKWAHNLHLGFYFERKKNSKIKELDYEKFLSDHLKNVVLEKENQVESAQSVENLTAQINALLSQVAELQVKQEPILADEERWEKEYLTLKEEKSFHDILEKINDVVYKYNGYTTNRIDSRLLAFAHVNELIIFLNENSSQIGLTPKGVYFLKRHFSDAHRF